MTEQEWLESADPAAMLEWITKSSRPRLMNVPPSPRKLRLFVCACCRSIWHLLADERSRRAVEVAERFADGQATEEEASRAERDTAAVKNEWSAFAAVAVNLPIGLDCFHKYPEEFPPPATQAALLRDIVGNPFRPVMRVRRDWKQFIHHDKRLLFYEKWLTLDVLSLATAAYKERLPGGTLDPFRLGLVADALEEAGCGQVPCRDCVRGFTSFSLDNAWKCVKCKGEGFLTHPLLAHLRSPGPHYRGCWALDLVLGKE